MKSFALFILMAFVVSNSKAQVRVKGIVTEANTNPAAGTVKKALAGVQIKAMGAVAPEVTDNSGFFTLVFQGKKPGDLIRGVSVQKIGYEVFNGDVLENWKVGDDPNWIDKIKMCPAGTLNRLIEYNYKNLYNTLIAQYEKQKGELKKLKISDADLNEKYRSLDEKFQSQQKQLAEYVERFVSIDFDEVSDSYRRAYFLFSKGELDSVAIVLEEADLMVRTTKRISERNRIQAVKAEAARQEEANKAGIKEDMEALKMLAQTYEIKFEYEKATPLYEQLVKLDSTNVDNLLVSAVFFGQVIKNYDRAIYLFSKVISLTDSLDWHQGSAKMRMGELQKETGFFEPALRNFQESYRIYKSLYVQDSLNKIFPTGLGEVMVNLGDIYLDMGRTEDALSYYTKCNSLLQTKINSNINDPELKRLLARSYRKLGDIHQTMGHLDEALKNFENCIQSFKELYESNPKNESLKHNLAISYSRLGDIQEEMGHLDEALKYFEDCNRSFKELHESNPKNESLKYSLAASYEWIGDIYMMQGHIEQALEYFEEDLKLTKELYEANPKKESLKDGLTGSYSRLGDIQKAMGHMNEALKYFEDYNKSAKELYESNHLNERLKNGLAISYYKLGDIHQAMGHLDEALKYVEENLKLSKELYEANPRNESLKIGFAASYERLGDIHKDMGHRKEALKCFEQNLKLKKEFTKSNPENILLKEGLAISYQRLGDLNEAMGHLDKALNYFEEYSRLMKKLYELNPKNESLKGGLATSYERLGDINQAIGHMDEALKYFEEDLKLSKELYEANLKNESLKERFAISYQRLGDINQTMNHMDEALKYFEDYNRLMKELHESNPKNESLKNSLAISYEKLVDHWARKNKWIPNYKGIFSYDNSEIHWARGHSLEELAAYCYTTGKIYKDCFQQTGIEKYDNWRMNCLSELDSICKSYLSSADSLLKLTFPDKARVYYLKADSLYLQKNEINQDLNNTWMRGGVWERLSSCATNDQEKLILLENALQLRLEAYKSYSDENTHSVIISNYGNLSWYYLLNKQYTKSESAIRTAIEIARKNKIKDSQYNWVYTNLAPSLLFQGKFEEAKKIYLEWKDKVFPQDTTKTFRFFFLKELDDLKQAGITHPDVENIKELLK